jgi:hypothetical protein
MPWKDPEAKKKYDNNYYKDHKTKVLERLRKRHQLPKVKQHRKDYMKDYYQRHKEERKVYSKKYKQTHPEINKKHNSKHRAKQRRLGDNLIWKPIIETEPMVNHHINLNDVVRIPERLHISIPHNVWTGLGMRLINDKVFEWLEMSSVFLPQDLYRSLSTKIVT